MHRTICSIDKEGDDVINCKKQLKRSKESRAKAPSNWRCNLTIYASFCCVQQFPEEGNNEEMQW